MTSDILNEREHLYRLIIGQLLYDGLNAEAYFLGNTVGIEMSLVPPSPRLLYAMRHQKIDYEAKKKQYSRAHKESLDYGYGAGNAVARTVCLDFDAIVDEITTPPISGYNSQYNTSHKGPVTCAEFSSDGRLMATGSGDNSIKIFMVERLFLKTYDIKADKNTKSKADDVSPQNHPVIRTLYEHTAPISALEFHPTHHVLISGGEDNQIFFYDLNKNAVKKAYKTISESYPIRSFSVHPSGDYIIVSVAHNIIRLYDINTLCCFATSSIETTHTGIVNSVKYDSNGRMYVSASEDGSFKIWDGVSNRCVNTFSNCHNSAGITSTRFSNNGKYILSASIDGVCRLWDIRNGQLIQAYHRSTIVNPTRCPAFFNHTEDYVIYLDDRSSHGCWNSRTGSKVCTIPSASNSTIQWAAHSPCEPAMVTCCADFRVRFINFGV